MLPKLIHLFQSHGTSTPLLLKRSLTANVPVIVDFQLRPSDTTHLAYAFNVLDWPHDDKAQIEDIDPSPSH